MTEKLHSELSPSSAERWWNCPGSVAACRGLKQVESEYARDGTAAHEVLERCLKGGANPFDMIGMTIQTVEVSEEMAEAVAYTIDVVQAELQKGGTLYVEQRLVIVKDEVEGTLDIAIVKPFEKIVIIDFKYGKGVIVKADDNKQLLLYFAGVYRKFDCDKGELVVVQPRNMTEEKVSRWECSVEYLETFMPEVVRHIALTKEKDAFLLPGSWCKFCLAKATCPALRGDLSTAMAPIQNRELIFPNVQSLPMDAIVKILDKRNQLDDWLDAVEMHAFSILEAGGAVPGYELAKKRAHRRWKDEQEVLAKFADLGNQLFKVKPISPAALEKLVGKERKAEIDKLTETPDIGLTLKKSADVKAIKAPRAKREKKGTDDTEL